MVWSNFTATKCRGLVSLNQVIKEIICLQFYFSSRRRHTRCLSDWSSDVCSSDLMRQYAGFGTAAQSNRRYHFLLGHGQTGLSVAFDLPTQMGRDSDHPLAHGEVGKVEIGRASLGKECRARWWQDCEEKKRAASTL